ncbi:cupin domain-containing protein [Methylobrevis albus]|uniref:Cupin domain-containing protein n=1 Tax=Methylobrevis albus TaxID=2793297 RepID=A0A931MYC7_9HYPH|nr:cupin domain-containing protein [Methylobrevis albus]MBH0236919.1 cupin domain-containing protein [Methylobrevis albus]
MKTLQGIASRGKSDRRSDTASIRSRETINVFEAIPGEHLAILVRAGDVSGRFCILESVAAPGTAAPLHSHAEEEVFYVLSGTPTFQLGNDIHEVRAGCTVVIPAGTPHAWINRSNADVRMLAIFAPGGIENMFSEIAGLPLDKVPPIAASYGTTVLGPPMQP